MPRGTKSMRPRLCFLVRVMRTPFSRFLVCFFIFFPSVFQKKMEFKVLRGKGKGCERERRAFVFVFFFFWFRINLGAM